MNLEPYMGVKHRLPSKNKLKWLFGSLPVGRTWLPIVFLLVCQLAVPAERLQKQNVYLAVRSEMGFPGQA